MNAADIFADLKARSEAATDAAIARLHDKMEQAEALALAPEPEPLTAADILELAARDAAKRQRERLEGRIRSTDFAQRFPNPHD